MPYYGYRYLTPELGRWINRDPIEEEGHKLGKKHMINNRVDVSVETTVDWSNFEIAIFLIDIVNLTKDSEDSSHSYFDLEIYLYSFVYNNALSVYDLHGEIGIVGGTIIGVGIIVGYKIYSGAKAFCNGLYLQDQTSCVTPWELIGENPPANPMAERARRFCKRMGWYGPVSP